MSEATLQPKVTITLTRYAEPDELVRTSLLSALRQQGVGGEVLFIDQQVDADPKNLQLPDDGLSLRIIRGRLNGLSEARNLAMARAKFPLVLFLDADAIADESWAFRMVQTLCEPGIGVVGSRIIPGWPCTPPIFARASVLRDQYSLLDLGEEIRPVGRVVGAGFGVDLRELPTGMVFDTKLGRRQGRLFGGEETDFCNRARLAGKQVYYVGTAHVVHLIQQERVKLNWILRRMIYAGHARAIQRGLPNPSRAPGPADWLLAPFYLPPYLLGWVWGKWSGQR